MTNMLHTDRIEEGCVLGNKVLVAEVFAKNGFLVLDSVTGEEQAAWGIRIRLTRATEVRTHARSSIHFWAASRNG